MRSTVHNHDEPDDFNEPARTAAQWRLPASRSVAPLSSETSAGEWAPMGVDKERAPCDHDGQTRHGFAAFD